MKLIFKNFAVSWIKFFAFRKTLMLVTEDKVILVLVDFFKIMTTKAEWLVGLAEDAGFKLSEVELKLLLQVAIGESADFSDEDEDKNSPKSSAEWNSSRCLSAKLIVWLCTEQEATQFLSYQGLKIIGARIEGSLDLNFLRMDFPLILRQCAFMGAIWLERAAVRFLDLSGSYVTSSQAYGTSGRAVELAINARGLNVEGDVRFQEEFCAIGEVSLQGAIIGGDLLCRHSTFSNAEGYALIAQNSEVKGSVFLDGSFEAVGEVNFRCSHIGGDFQCKDGKFKNARRNTAGVSLNLSGCEIKGNVSFIYDFESTGIVSLSNTFIGGNLNCCMGKFHNESRDHQAPSLVINSAEIRGSVLLNWVHSIGQVQLSNSSVSGNINCRNGRFEVNKNSSWHEQENLPISLRYFLDDDTPLCIEGMDIRGSVLLSENFTANGWVSFVGSKIGKTFNFTPEYPAHVSVDFRSARISTLWDRKESWPEHGNLVLNGFVYERIALGSPVNGADRLNWIRRQNLKDNFSPQPYEQAARVLQASGHQEAAIKVLIGKQDDLRKYGGLSKIKQFWNLFLSRTIAHGYKPHRALLFSLVIVFIGLIIFDLGYTHGLIEPSELEAYSISNTKDLSTSAPIYSEPDSSPQMPKTTPSYPEFYSLMYSMDVFLPIIDFHQESFWIPRASRGKEISPFKLRWGGVLLAYFWLHISLGWVFTSLWVAGFTGLVRRLE